MSNDNPHPDDTALSALLDGELPPDESERLRRRLAEEPALAARFEALKRVNDAVRERVTSEDMGPVPERVLERLREPAPARDGGSNVVPLRPRRRLPQAPIAIAAAVALAVGFLLAQIVPGGNTTPLALTDTGGRVGESSPLFRVLESVPSGERRDIGRDLAATPTMTFRRDGGGYCRRVDIEDDRGVTRSLACRADGAWQITAASFEPRAGNAVYRPASRERSVIEAVVDDVIAGEPLGRSAESELLSRGWQ